MQEKNKRLFDNILSQGALQAVNYVIPLIAYPYQVRVIGVEKFGLIAFAMSLIYYFNSIVDYGFNWSATKSISQNRHNQNNISNIFNSVIIIKITLMLICFLFLLGLIYFVPKFHQDWLIFLYTFIFIVGTTIYPTWFFIGQERVRYITCISIMAKMIFLISLFVFVKRQEDYILVPLLNGIGSLTAGIIGFRYAVKNFNVKLYFPKISTIIKYFKESTQFFFSSVAISLYSNTNTFCLGLIGSKLMVGYYAAAEKIFYAILGLRYPVDVSLFPYMAKNKDIDFFKKFATIAILLNTLICIAIIIYSKQLTLLVFGENMVPAYKVLQIFCLSAILEFPSVVGGYQLLVAFEHKIEANCSVYVTVIFHIIGLGILYLINKLDMYSISWMILCSTTLTLAIRIYFINKFKIFQYTNN